MIVVKTPLRMSFVGGGSDLPSFYRKNGGAVISTAINKYIYTSINKKFDKKIRVSYSQTEEVNSVHDIKHKLVRESLKYLDINDSIEISTVADVPSHGTGLGSSSAFVVGLLHGLHAFKQQNISAAQLSEFSSHLEINICEEPIGKQDQYAVAFGGLNLIEFNEDDSVLVTPLNVEQNDLTQLQKNILFFYTGIARSASDLLSGINQDLMLHDKLHNILKQMVDLTYELKSALELGNIDALGFYLHQNWLLKKTLCKGISSDSLDETYTKALKAGALGGKILGAGGGGFIMFYAPHEKHANIIKALSHLQPIPIQFERLGSHIIYND